jgi:hypothetical protein
MNDMVKKVNEFKKFFDKIESEFNGLRNNIATKASIKALGDLKVDMGLLASKEDYKSVKDVIGNFERDLTKFKVQNETHS